MLVMESVLHLKLLADAGGVSHKLSKKLYCLVEQDWPCKELRKRILYTFKQSHSLGEHLNVNC